MNSETLIIWSYIWSYISHCRLSNMFKHLVSPLFSHGFPWFSPTWRAFRTPSSSKDRWDLCRSMAQGHTVSTGRGLAFELCCWCSVSGQAFLVGCDWNMTGLFFHILGLKPPTSFFESELEIVRNPPKRELQKGLEIEMQLKCNPMSQFLTGGFNRWGVETGKPQKRLIWHLI